MARTALASERSLSEDYHIAQRLLANMGLTLDLGTPVNTALFLYILYAVQRIIFPPISKPATVPNEFKAGYSWLPKAHPPAVLFKVYTPKTLEPFNGRDNERILLAINGIVFDVTAGRNFYGPGMPRLFVSLVCTLLTRDRRNVW